MLPKVRGGRKRDRTRPASGVMTAVKNPDRVVYISTRRGQKKAYKRGAGREEKAYADWRTAPRVGFCKSKRHLLKLKKGTNVKARVTDMSLQP